MSNNEQLMSFCTEAIARMSNLGMAIKTAGVTLFGAGVANLLGSSGGDLTCIQRWTYCAVLALLGVLFIYMDVSYLSRERAFREIHKLLLQNRWNAEFLDLSVIYKSMSKYPNVTRRKCLQSFSVLPIIIFELTTVSLLLIIQ